MWFTRTLWVFVLLACAVNAVPKVPLQDKRSFVRRNGVNYTVFEHAASGSKIEFVKNSGICETTPGVNQYSGYLSVGANMSMWFWFFESRNDPATAPLAAWFNGGPGCSSMIGLFQENGPCRFVNNASTPSLNPYSFNDFANMLYVDQPVGVGFSYGADNVTSTQSAAPLVWKLLQAFYSQFPQYKNRDFGIFTESYGGHYGPEFAHYIQQQNTAIKNGSVKGEPIRLVALGINNGWFDSAIQEKAYIEFAQNNTHRQLINESRTSSLLDSYYKGCLPEIQKCNQSGNVTACQRTDDICGVEIHRPIQHDTYFDPYDVRQSSDDDEPIPPETYLLYLNRDSVLKAIGARTKFEECSSQSEDNFGTTGDHARSFLPTLSTVIQSGIQVLVWAGDADYICNWMGVQGVADAVEFLGQDAFRNKQMDAYTVNGTQQGTFKSVDNFSFLRVFGAGHEVPYYQPEVSLQVFKQTLQKSAISST